jgi:putative addiction module component (TIGR02574 family)
VSLKEIEREALALTERERAALVAALLDTLPDIGVDVSDAEVDQRERDLHSGAVEPLSHEEFVRRVQSERQR